MPPTLKTLGCSSVPGGIGASLQKCLQSRLPARRSAAQYRSPGLRRVRCMVTAEEIGGVTIFAALDPADRERLARAAADISLVPGEYAAYQGGERALFAVLDGRIEAVMLVDGIERVVGERHPGDIFGEVP